MTATMNVQLQVAPEIVSDNINDMLASLSDEDRKEIAKDVIKEFLKAQMLHLAKITNDASYHTRDRAWHKDKGVELLVNMIKDVQTEMRAQAREQVAEHPEAQNTIAAMNDVMQTHMKEFMQEAFSSWFQGHMGAISMSINNQTQNQINTDFFMKSVAERLGGEAPNNFATPHMS